MAHPLSRARRGRLMYGGIGILILLLEGCGPSDVGSITLKKPADRGPAVLAGAVSTGKKTGSRRAKVKDESLLPAQQALPPAAKRKG